MCILHIILYLVILYIYIYVNFIHVAKYFIDNNNIIRGEKVLIELHECV